MTEFMEYLKERDRERLLSKAERKHFTAEEVILAEGDPRRALFLVRSGEVRVERKHGEFAVEVARLKSGEIFGEMSFIEGYQPTASIVADEECDVDVVDAAQLKALIKEDPGFYGRFYHTLAVVLSRRLESTTDSLSSHSWGGEPFAADASAGHH